MTRLTNAIREAVVKNAVAKSAYPERNNKYKLRRRELAEKIRCFAVGEGVEKLDSFQNEITKLSNKFFETNPGLVSLRSAVAIAHHRNDIEVYLPGENRSKDFYFGGSKISPYSITLEAGHELTEQVYNIELELKELEELLNEIKTSVGNIVSSVGSIKRLLEIWPEAKSLLPTDLTPRAPVPTLPVGDVNKLLGLPENEND